MSSGVTLTCLFFASVEAGSTLVKIGITNRPIAAMCRTTASIWLVPKFSSFDQMSFTFTGRIPGGRGGCFGGEKKSLTRSPNPPKFAPHATASLLFTRPLDAGRRRKNSARLPATPDPKVVCVKGASLRSRTLTGRSVRNCFRFDQKLSGIRISGFVNFGTAVDGTGTAGPRPADDTLGFVISGGSRLINLPGTVYLFSLDADSPYSVCLSDMIRAGRERLRAPWRLTPVANHCNIRGYAASRCFPPYTCTNGRHRRDLQSLQLWPNHSNSRKR